LQKNSNVSRPHFFIEKKTELKAKDIYILNETMKATNVLILASIVTRCRSYSITFVRTASLRPSSHRDYVSPFVQQQQKYVVSQRSFRYSPRTTSTALSAVPLVIPSRITKDDNAYMKIAIDAAARGKGNTYPNPAVGCVLVSDNSDIIGIGFHPRAGYPHAEVFALFEACGYVPSGVDAALSIVQEGKNRKVGDRSDTSDTVAIVHELLQTYSSDHGVEKLFKDKLVNQGITAYVTLEPCCHYGKTPPCAMSLVQAGVQRVVVGFRDPNPRVDGGGVLILQENGIQVDLMDALNGNEMEKQNAKDCKDLVTAFVNRIKPRDVNGNDGFVESDYDQFMNGAKRRLLRNIAGRQKQEGTSIEIDWTCSGDSVEDVSGDGLEEAIQNLELNHVWMERVDEALWKNELLVLRLTRAVKKKKGAKLLGERIATELGATVAQTVGHSVLLYRPRRPPILNFEELMSSSDDDVN
jgi:pyrimidine deaminase RibD-like protein/RNA-binding protein YhbY